MSGFNIQLNWDMVDKIVVGQLIDTLKCFREYLGHGNDIFVFGDPEADDVQIQKHIDALELVLTWFATPDQLKELGIDG